MVAGVITGRYSTLAGIRLPTSSWHTRSSDISYIVGTKIVMQEIAGWVGPIATMCAAIMTAANLGSRITGWGFVVFAIGSLAWTTVAAGSGQQNLLLTNGFLTFVNALGIWRWLGKQASYEDGGEDATARSAAAPVPTLLAISAIPGSKLMGREGASIGVVIDGMVQCTDKSLAYLVVSEGGLGGVGERLHLLHPYEVRMSDDGLQCDLTADDLSKKYILKAGRWPATLDPE